MAGNLNAAKKNSPVMPEWVNTPALVYPNSTYVSYVGYGSDRNKAEVQAVSGLASVFGQSVKSSTTSSQRMSQAKSEGKVATTNISILNQDVLKTVDVSCLVGVEVKEFWFDGESTWYAIAVLEKEKAVDIYSDMIKKNAKAVSDLIAFAKKDIASIEAYAACDFAQDIAAENEEHLRKLSVINASSVAALKPYVPSSKDLAAKKQEIAKNIPVAVLISGDETGEISAAFTECLGHTGFRGSLDASVRYLIAGEVSFEESKTSDGKTTRCRYTLESFLLDSETDQKLVPFNANGREGHVQYQEAKNRATKSLVKKINGEFKNSFDDYLKNFVSR